MHRRTRVLALPFALLVALAGCTAAPAVPSADVVARESAVTVASEEGEPTEVAEESVAAQEGDVVETDAGGRAELTYPDGSLTRLGPDTLLTIVELSTAEAQRTVMQLDVGQTWHRVEDLVAEDSAYEVQTPVGVAAVRGTEFTVECTDEPSCRIVVLDGTVEFTPTDGEPIAIEPFQVLVVPAPEGQELGVTALPSDAVAGDEWLSENVDVDELDTADAAGSLAGTWTTSVLLTSSGHRPGDVGVPRDATWEIAPPVCDALCTSAVVSSSGATFTLEYLTDGYHMAGTQVANCFQPETGEILDPDWADIVYDITLQAAEAGADGRPSRLTGSRVDQFTARPDGVPGCANLPSQSEEIYEVTLSR